MRRFGHVHILLSVLLLHASRGMAQQSAGDQPVVIHRRMVRLTPPDAYRLAFSLRASRQLTLSAGFEGKVERTAVSQGQKVTPQTELVAIDSKRLELLHRKALAGVQVAEAELRLARIDGNADRIALGEARVELAQADLDLIKFDKNQTSFRAPFEATVLKVHVKPGEEVGKGTPLVTIGDLSSLECRVPVDRKTAVNGQPITLTIEDSVVVGMVKSIDPVSDDQQNMRDLAVSVAMANVSIRNSDGKFATGQAVFPTIIPDDPVTRVPLEAVKTGANGSRTVQVLRDHIVRNVPVRLHGQVGKGDVYVSGPFTESDQVIMSTSVELADSTAVRPTAVSAASGRGGSSAGAETATAPARTNQRPKSGAAGF